MTRSWCLVARVSWGFYRLPVGVACMHVHRRPRAVLFVAARGSQLDSWFGL